MFLGAVPEVCILKENLNEEGKTAVPMTQLSLFTAFDRKCFHKFGCANIGWFGLYSRNVIIGNFLSQQ